MILKVHNCHPLLPNLTLLEAGCSLVKFTRFDSYNCHQIFVFYLTSVQYLCREGGGVEERWTGGGRCVYLLWHRTTLQLVLWSTNNNSKPCKTCSCCLKFGSIFQMDQSLLWHCPKIANIYCINLAVLLSQNKGIFLITLKFCGKFNVFFSAERLISHF